MSGQMKDPFVVLGVDRAGGTVTYEADFWEGPVEAGTTGRYRRYRVASQWTGPRVPAWNGERWLIGRPLNEAHGLSYFTELMGAFAKIGCHQKHKALAA